MKPKAQVKGIMHVKTEVDSGSPDQLMRSKREKNMKVAYLGSPFNFTTNFFSNVSIGYDVLLHTFQYLKVQVSDFRIFLVENEIKYKCSYIGTLKMCLCLPDVGASCESYDTLEDCSYEKFDGQ